MSDPQPITMRQHWADAQGYLKIMTDPAAYQIWIQPLQPQAYANGVLTLAAPDSIVRDRCAHRLDRIIRNALYFQTGKELVVEYVLQNGGSSC